MACRAWHALSATCRATVLGVARKGGRVSVRRKRPTADVPRRREARKRSGQAFPGLRVGSLGGVFPTLKTGRRESRSWGKNLTPSVFRNGFFSSAEGRFRGREVSVIPNGLTRAGNSCGRLCVVRLPAGVRGVDHVEHRRAAEWKSGRGLPSLFSSYQQAGNHSL